MLLVSQGNINLFAQDPTGGCPCDCDEIINGTPGASTDFVFTENPYESDCYILNFSITGCGNRTILGFQIEFQGDPQDPCLNQNWAVKDIIRGVEYGSFIPATQPSPLAFFSPPVAPCETRNFSFQFCLEDGNACRHKNYNFTVNFIYGPENEPCPPFQKSIAFNNIMNVESDINLINNTFSMRNKSLTINLADLKDFQGGAEVLIVNSIGEIVLKEFFKYNDVIILDIKNFITGSYYLSLSNQKDNILKYNFNIIK